MVAPIYELPYYLSSMIAKVNIQMAKLFIDLYLWRRVVHVQFLFVARLMTFDGKKF